MHDTLHYMEDDPVYRKYHYGGMTFGMIYAYSERFMLPLSHDEVVHGKGSLFAKMPGDPWQKLANLRAYYGFMWGHPGKKLLFMGGEIAQPTEWNNDASLVWDLLDDPAHAGVQTLIGDLNRLYANEPALQYGDLHPEGFEWAVADDAENSVYGMLRTSPDGGSKILVMSNMTPVPRNDYRVGVPVEGRWEVVLNTDAQTYGGANLGQTEAWTENQPAHGKPHSVSLVLPPLATVFLRWRG
jgi:1,4-alpha-glucan branching enzyme